MSAALNNMVTLESYREELRTCLSVTKTLGKGDGKPSEHDIQQKPKKRNKHYFTCGREIDPQGLAHLNNSTFPFRVPWEGQNANSTGVNRKNSEKILRGRNGTPVYRTRQTYRTRQAEGLNERLYVPQEDTKLPGKSVVPDIDGKYFSQVAGRPIRDGFTGTRKYITEIQDAFRVNLMTSWRYDEMHAMDQQNSREAHKLAELNKKVQFYNSTFEEFLAEDHNTSMALLAEADLEKKISQEKAEQIRVLSREFNLCRTQIVVLDGKWKNRKSYQSFLYKMSPKWWRDKFVREEPNSDDTKVEFSEMMRALSSQVKTKSTQNLMEQVMKDISKSDPAVNYFEEPSQVHWILRQLEKNNTMALLQCEQLAPPVLIMMSGLEKARSHYNKELLTLEGQLYELEKAVRMEEEVSRNLEEEAKDIAFGLFKRLVVDREILKIHTAVEKCYSTCVAAHGEDPSLSAMMKEIEMKHEKLSLTLDQMPTNIAVAAVKESYKEDFRLNKEAEKSEASAKQIGNLLRSLQRSMAPRREGKPPRSLMWRSRPPKEKMEVKQVIKPLTQEEQEYLYFFTDVCPTEDHKENRRFLKSCREE